MILSKDKIMKENRTAHERKGEEKVREETVWNFSVNGYQGNRKFENIQTPMSHGKTKTGKNAQLIWQFGR